MEYHVSKWKLFIFNGWENEYCFRNKCYYTNEIMASFTTTQSIASSTDKLRAIALL